MVELRKFLIPLRKWWWLLLSATLLAASTSTYVYSRQPPTYQARTVLMIGRTIDDPNPTTASLTLSQQLASIYASLAHQDVVRGATMSALGIRRLPDYRAAAIPNSQFIEIVVKDTDPEMATLVANELANQLILKSPTSPNTEDQNRLEFVNQQLNVLESQISETQAEIDTLQNELGDLTSALQITDTRNQINALQSKLNILQSNYANLLTNTRGGASNILTIIEPASLPSRPVGPRSFTTIFLVSAVALALSASGAYLLEYLDDTIRSPEDIHRIIGRPVLASITEITEGLSDGIYVEDHPDTAVADAFRLLKLNIILSERSRPAKTILVTSADEMVGKTTVAMNLALTFAQSEKKVVLLDADLRKSSLKKRLGFEDQAGLSDFLRKPDEQDVLHLWKDRNLAIIPSGAPISNPAELFLSPRIDRLLTRLEQAAKVVIIDGPPLPVVDTSILASKVDGILLLVRPGYTSKSLVQAMMNQLDRIGVRVLGVVLNRVTTKNVDFHIEYLYQDAYYSYKESGDNDLTMARNGNFEKSRSWLRHLASSIRQKK